MQNNNEVLIKSLKFINQSVTDDSIILNSSEFLNVHNRNIVMLKEFLKTDNSKALFDETNKYPDINEAEVKIYFEKKKKEISLLMMVGGVFIDSFYNLLKSKGVTYSDIKEKMLIVVTVNERLIRLIENPYLGNLYS